MDQSSDQRVKIGFRRACLIGASCLAAAVVAGPGKTQEMAAHESKVTPLFAGDSVIDVTIAGPVKKIARGAERSTEAYPATLKAAGETHQIELSARGLSRRKKENCRFPPLRIVFSGEKGEDSLFKKQGRIKLVTHCNDKDAAEQTVLREYAAYRLYNVVTPESHKVRLARITYLDGGKEVTTRLGFFIEDTDDTARRVGKKEVDTGTVSTRALVRGDLTRYFLFQYMIGNTDFAVYTGPNPDDCCHNSKLLGASKDAESELTPVPYDFDNSGLVDAPYAVPNQILKIRSVTQRVYRGFCALNPQMTEPAAAFRGLRPEFEAEIMAIPEMSDGTRSKLISYLGGFFDDIASDEALQKNVLKNCR
ncbi:hypothetical protein [Altererythrobacter sp. MF3-039]|uniref:hypothetical protein n=1 Tax=Altererythrobacter sp. MF3-039 TaxID=3252901 RepID=UPI00390CD6CF